MNGYGKVNVQSERDAPACLVWASVVSSVGSRRLLRQEVPQEDGMLISSVLSLFIVGSVCLLWIPKDKNSSVWTQSAGSFTFFSRNFIGYLLDFHSFVVIVIAKLYSAASQTFPTWQFKTTTEWNCFQALMERGRERPRRSCRRFLGELFQKHGLSTSLLERGCSDRRDNEVTLPSRAMEPRAMDGIDRDALIPKIWQIAVGKTITHEH